MTISPIEAELLRNAMSSIVDEMFISLMKSSYSTNIKERKDHSTALFDKNGRVVVQGESMPLHLASMLGLVEIVLEKYGEKNINQGDVFLSNDPYVGRGSHLPDVAMAAPIFFDFSTSANAAPSPTDPLDVLTSSASFFIRLRVFLFIR